MQRVRKVAQQLKKEIGKILQEDIKDPRLGFVTVTELVLSPDLKYAKVYLAHFGSKDQEERSFQALQSAKGFIRHLLAQRVSLRFVPEISFEIDRSSVISIDILKQLEKLKKEQ